MDRIENSADFWSEMVVPDYQDSSANIDNLRLAFHCAISLYHMADLVFITHETCIKMKFSFIDSNNMTIQVSNPSSFANALEQVEQNFALIRGIANSAKRLKLNTVRPHPNAPSHAASTASKGSGWGRDGYNKDLLAVANR